MREHPLRLVPIDLPKDETLIWWMRTGENTAHHWSAIQKLLSASEQERANRFHFDRDRYSYSVAHAMTRLLTASLLSRAPQTITFEYNTWGKPELFEASGLRVNWSHTHGLAAVAVAWADDVGIDVECLNRRVAYQALAERYFSSAEARIIADTPNTDRADVFFRLWTLKEAFVKAVGRGLSLPLDSFEIKLSPDSCQPWLVRSPIDFGPARQWQLWDSRIGPCHQVAMVRRNGHWRGDVRTCELTANDLINPESRLSRLRCSSFGFFSHHLSKALSEWS